MHSWDFFLRSKMVTYFGLEYIVIWSNNNK
jgi:hypothetical protein